MSVLVTVGTGFIGSHLLRRFVDEGKTVVAYDAFQDYNAVINIKDQVVVKKGDVLDLAESAQALEEHSVDAIVHMVSVLALESQTRPMTALRTNVEGTVNVLEAARIAGIK